MTENYIRELRRKKGLTQRELAGKAGTSQQQIQRIEAGVQAARFDLATRLAAALGEPLPRVFPATEEALRQSRKRHKSPGQAADDAQLHIELEEAGLDMQAEQWMVKYRLRGGAEGVLTISGPEHRRLWRLLDPHNDEEGFMVFDAGDRRFAINPVHLTFCHLIFEGASVEAERAEDQSEDGYEVRFWLADCATPLTFGVEPDTASIDDETEDGECQLQDLFYYAENGTETRLKFKDEDGEMAFFRVRDVAMFSAPLEAVEPKLLAAARDGIEEVDETRATK
jgi:transcriptional regulator with XRE-family HTH domain